MESIKAQQASSIESLRSDIRNAIVVENIKIDSKLDRLTDRLERTEVQVVGVINQVKALASRPAAGSPSLPEPTGKKYSLVVGFFWSFTHLSYGTSL